MHSFTTAAALVASASLSLAAPAKVAGRSTFEVHQVDAGSVVKNHAASIVRTYQKYGKAAPAHVVAAAAASGSVVATPESEDRSYLCPVTVGGSTLNLDFDTGSSDLWVFSSETPSSESSGHTLYNPKTSGTKKQGYSWSIQYGDNSGAAGDVYADKVVVGGVTATSQAVEAATSVSSEFESDTQNDGLLGLGFSKGTNGNTVKPQAQTTFFETVKGGLAKALFTADLKHQEPGSYTFGYIDSSKYTGSITYFPADGSQGYWAFQAGGYSVGSSNATTGSVGSSILDTGTTLMYLPSNVVSDYYSKIPGSQNSQTDGGYVFPCSATVPDFNVAIGGKTFTVPSTLLNLGAADQSGSTCFGGLQTISGIDLSIFGDVFLKSVYAIFDQSTGSPRIGLATQN